LYAARELREHAGWYYGAATADAGEALLTAEELMTVISIFNAAHKRALGATPGDVERHPRQSGTAASESLSREHQASAPEKF